MQQELLVVSNDVELWHIAAAGLVLGLSTLIVFFLFYTPAPMTTGKTSSKVQNSNLSKPVGKFLNQADKAKKKAPITEIVQVSHDTKLFKLALPADSCLGLPCGKHIKIFAPNPNAGGKVQWNGAVDSETDDEIERKYTPTSSDEDIRRFDLLIKVYKPNERFSHGGKMSQYFDSLKVGDEIEFSGPWGIIEYLGKGVFKKSVKQFRAKHVGMIAGGSGITPMLQVLDAILRDKADETTVSLIFGNQTEADILLYSELNDRAKRYPKKFKVHYTLDRPPENWEQSTGFVNKEMVEKHMPAPSDDTVILLCGPAPMVKFACKPNLELLNYKMDQVLEF